MGGIYFTKNYVIFLLGKGNVMEGIVNEFLVKCHKNLQVEVLIH